MSGEAVLDVPPMYGPRKSASGRLPAVREPTPAPSFRRHDLRRVHRERWIGSVYYATGQRLSAMQQLAVYEVALHGTSKEAASCLGMAAQTFKNQCQIAYIRLGVENAIEALRAMGVIDFHRDERRNPFYWTSGTVTKVS